MTPRVDPSSESFLLEDAGPIRRNWRVGLRVIFGLFWAAGRLSEMVPDSAGNRLPRPCFKCRGRAAEHRRFMGKVLGGYCKFNPRLPLHNSHNRNPHCHIHHHRTLHKTYLISRNCLPLHHLEYRRSFRWSLHPRRHRHWNGPSLHGHVRRAHSRPRWNATRSRQTHPKEIFPPQPSTLNPAFASNNEHPMAIEKMKTILKPLIEHSDEET